MPSHSKTKKIYRVIDANFNRLKEGLRVCEEIARFIINSPALSLSFKEVRHRLDSIIKQLVPNDITLLKDRDSLRDAGKDIHLHELKRENYRDIFFANIQRAKESVRVLEEFAKLIDKNIALKFKRIRYAIYEIEKKAAGRISALYYLR